MNRQLFSMVALCFGCMSTAAKAEDTFVLELSGGYVDGPGMDDTRGFNRRISDIDSGRRWRLDGRWQPTQRWYVLAMAERSTLNYENPENTACPVHAGRFPPVTSFCAPERFEREGRIDDDLDHARLGAGWKLPLGEQFVAHFEAGYGYMRWDSSDDYEITAAAQCIQWKGIDVGNTARRAHCTPVDVRATDGGLFGRLGLDWNVGSRFKLGASAHHQAYRYRIYRNDVVPRIAAANCFRLDICPDANGWVDFHATDTTGDSWTWYGVRADLALDRRWGVFLSLEGGGNRDWTTADLGVRFGF